MATKFYLRGVARVLRLNLSKCSVAFKFNRRGDPLAMRLNLASAEIFVRRVNFKI